MRACSAPSSSPAILCTSNQPTLRCASGGARRAIVVVIVVVVVIVGRSDRRVLRCVGVPCSLSWSLNSLRDSSHFASAHAALREWRSEAGIVSSDRGVHHACACASARACACACAVLCACDCAFSRLSPSCCPVPPRIGPSSRKLQVIVPTKLRRLLPSLAAHLPPDARTGALYYIKVCSNVLYCVLHCVVFIVSCCIVL